MGIGVNQDWLPGYDRPGLNQWYQCKRRDDWYKILKEGRDTVNNVTLYKVVSFRDGKDMFNGLSLAQARSVIEIETNKIQIFT